MKDFQMSICLFLLMSLLFANTASANSNADELIAAYKPFIPQICSMLEAEQNLIEELNHVGTMMKIDDFMKFQVNDASVPAPIRKSIEKVQRITKQSEEISSAIPDEKIKKLRSKLTSEDEKRVTAYLESEIKKNCPSVGNHTWEQGLVGQWIEQKINEKKAPKVTEEINFEQLQKSAKSGNSNAKFVLGSRLVRGFGIKQDCEMGIDWLKQASAEGLASASFALSRVFDGIVSCQERDANLSKKYNALYLEQSKSIKK